MTTNNEQREAVARKLCEQLGGEPDALPTNEHDTWEGPLWTAFVSEADEILAILAPTDIAREGEAWMPIETAPKDGQGIIVIDMGAESPEPGTGYWAGNVWSCVDPNPREAIDYATIQAITWVSPTHWMPLPAAPGAHPPEQIADHGKGGEVV